MTSQKWITIALASALLASGQSEAAAEKQLQAAIHKERVDGDFRGAIAAYRKVISGAGKNRAVAAQAQLRLGQCYERLGAADAAKVYRELLRLYADQTAVVAEAQARLTALTLSDRKPGLSQRLLWDDAPFVYGRVSLDGRYMSFVDWASGGNVGLRDFRTGSSRIVNRVGNWPVSDTDVTFTALSNDGKRIAYLYRNNKAAGRGRSYEIRVVNADGANDHTIYKGLLDEYMEPVAWLMDNRRVAVMTWGVRGTLTPRLLYVNADDGKVTVRMETAEAWPAFSADGKWFAYNSSRDRGPKKIYIGTVEGTEPPTEFAGHESGDEVKGWSPDGRYLLLLSRRNGAPGLWLLPVANGRVTGEAQFVKGNFPERVYSLAVLPTGAFVYGTTEHQQKSLLAGIDLAKMLIAPQPTPYRPERGENFGARWSPDGERTFYRVGDRFVFREAASGVEYDVLPRMKSIGRYAEWMPKSKAVLVFGADRMDRTGFYSLDPRSGDCRFLIPSQAHPNWGFATVMQDEQTIFYNSGNGISKYDVVTGTSQPFYRPGKGSPRAVAISPDGRALAVVVNGTLQILDSKTAEIKREVPAPKPGDAFASAAWLQDGSSIVAELWSQGWAQNSSLVRIPLDGAPGKSVSLGTGTNGFSLSPDGRSLLLNVAKFHYQVWMLENFLPVPNQ
jgi:Tol biopolymer transport system component